MTRRAEWVSCGRKRMQQPLAIGAGEQRLWRGEADRSRRFAYDQHLFGRLYQVITFARPPPSQYKSARTTNAIERLHAGLKRRIKTHTLLAHWFG